MSPGVSSFSTRLRNPSIAERSDWISLVNSVTESSPGSLSRAKNDLPSAFVSLTIWLTLLA